MGTILLLFSLLCVAVGTWKLIGIYKAEKADSKPLSGGRSRAWGLRFFFF
ncbi:hypothetical protein [Brevibacillus brevis]